MKQLEELIETHEWLLGAVNYDEDLHFSTYYLRASWENHTGGFYPGYSAILAFYEGFNERYYLRSDECLSNAKAILERALENPEWLRGIVREIVIQSDRLGTIFPRETSAAMLSTLSKEGILALYEKHHEGNTALYRYARVPEALDRGVSYFTNYLREHLAKIGVPAAERDHVFVQLTQPGTLSVLARELVEFDAIVRSAKCDTGMARLLAQNPRRVMMLLDPEVLGRLEEHLERWKFLEYHGYGRRELSTLADYLERLASHLGDPGLDCNIKGLQERVITREVVRKHLFDQFKIDPTHRVLFELYPEIGNVKLYRRYSQLRNFYYLDLLLGEVARRLHVDEWTLRGMRPEEVMEHLRSGAPVDPAMRERKQGCLYVCADGREQVVTGERVQELRRRLDERREKRDTRILKGVVACKGHVVGTCKIVIRAGHHVGAFDRGSILVSESTDPDLVKYLKIAGGVLTEQGGVTSHAAIICREVNIPTITGIPGLLDSLHDGDVVEVDATAGVVRIVPETKTPLPPMVYDESRELSPGIIGTKAYNLGILRRLGYKVPDFVVLDFEAVARLIVSRESERIDDLGRWIGDRLKLGAGETLALRSSSVQEDSEAGSQAGRFASLLPVRVNELYAALSQFVEKNGREEYRGSIIVQRVIHPDWSGVCLTRDGRSEFGDALIMEIGPGGNQEITSGSVTPGRVVVDRDSGEIVADDGPHRRPGADSPDVRELIRRFLGLEDQFRKPLDIEWAYADELNILQVRPIASA